MPTDRDYWKPDRVVYRRKPAKQRALFNKNRLILIGCIGIFLLVYWGVYTFLHLAVFRITTVAITGTETISSAAVRASIETKISGDQWYLLPRNNILFFSPAIAETMLRAQFAAIKTVAVEKHFPHEISVALSERAPWAIYCKARRIGTATSSAIDIENEQCFFMDTDGVIFQDAPRAEGSLIRQFISIEGATRTVGDRVLDPKELLRFESLAKTFREMAGVIISGFELRENAPQDVWVTTSSGYDIIVTRADDYQKVSVIIKTVLENEVRDRIPRLSYIDARFGNKLFVKYR